MVTVDASAPRFRATESISTATSLVLAHFGPLMLLSLPSLLPQLLVLFAPEADPSGIPSPEGLALQGVAVLLGLLTYGVTIGMLMRATYQARHGGGIDFAGCVATGLSRFLPSIGFFLLLYLAIIGIAIPVAIAAVILPPLAILVGLAAFIFLVILILRWWVAIPAVVIERIGPLAAMRRSAEMTRGRKAGLLGALLLFMLVVFLLAIVFGIAAVPVAIVFGGDGPGLIVVVLLNAVFGMAINAYAAVFQLVVYEDLRKVAEGMTSEDLISKILNDFK